MELTKKSLGERMVQLQADQQQALQAKANAEAALNNAAAMILRVDGAIQQLNHTITELNAPAPAPAEEMPDAKPVPGKPAKVTARRGKAVKPEA